MKAILGKKLEMSQVFTEQGVVVPITLLYVEPCQVLQKKTSETDNYESVQIGFDKLPKRKERKSLNGKQYRTIREFKIDGEIKVGDTLTVSQFKEGDLVKVSAISKGKGFQGGVKRHGFSGRDATHGVKHEERKIGSVGNRFPQRVVKGRRMPGRMGSDRITVSNLKVVKVDAERNLLAVKGAVPGRKGTIVEIKGSL